MEVGTTEIAYLVEGTQWVVGDRADFEYRIVGDYDCYASFGDDASTSTVVTPSYTPSPVMPSYTPSPTYYSGGSSGASSLCAVSSNWGSMKINPYWGSTTSFLNAMIYNAPTTITSFSIKGSGQSSYQSCVRQSATMFQCYGMGTINEPASVMLNGGAYYGIDIIESMTGSSAMYPLSSCSGSIGSGFALYNTTDVKDEDNDAGDNGTDWLHIVQYCGFTLSGLAVIVASIHRIRQSKKKKANAMEKVKDEENADDDCGDAEEIEIVCADMDGIEKETITA